MEKHNFKSFLSMKKSLIYFIFIISIFEINNKLLYNLSKLILSNEIKIKINEGGTQYILYSNYIFIPDQIMVNGNPTNIDEENRIINLQSGEKIITMKWNNRLNDCNFMFKDLTNIIEIDLSKFDSSEVETMQGMFYGCNNIKNIIMNNIFVTNKVTNMGYMFCLCESLISIDLSNFNTHLVLNMAYFFSDCISLISIDLSNFDTSSVINMSGMFKNCISLKSLNLSNIDTSKVSSMAFLFSNCFSLTSLDVSSFNTSITEYMAEMFYNCSSLKSLDLSNFNTKTVYFISSMFYNCQELIELNLSNFDTSNVYSFYKMFYNCKKLVTLDISNFDMRNSYFLIDMLYNCKNLEYINFNNSIENIDGNFSNIFYGIQKNIVYCSNNEENIRKIISEFKERTCIINDCTNNWKNKRKKIIDETNTCVDDCKEDNEYFYEYKNKCYKNCPEGTHPLYYINYLCIKDCSEKYPFEKSDECLDSCSGSDFFNKLCRISNHTIQTKQIYYKYYYK